MARTYKNYYVLVPIKALVQYPIDPPDPVNNIYSQETLFEVKDEKEKLTFNLGPKAVDGKMYFGSRFSTLLLEAPAVLLALGLVPESVAYGNAPDCDEPITAVKLSTQSDVIKIGVFAVYSFILIPKNPEETIPPYNNKYSTRIPASGNLDPKTVAQKLYGLPFTISNGDRSAVYVVQSNSIKKVGSKKFSGTIPLL